MSTLTCGGRHHVITESRLGEKPWCNCGQIRNQAYRRTLWQRLTGRPKRPAA